MLGLVWDYADRNIKKESSADLLMTAYYGHSNYLLKKNDELALYTQIHDLLLAKIPITLPCHDSTTGIPLSAPSVQLGLVTVHIPGGFLSLTFGLLNAYLSKTPPTEDHAKRVFAYENY